MIGAYMCILVYRSAFEGHNSMECCISLIKQACNDSTLIKKNYLILDAGITFLLPFCELST